jgi:hypothetical protein
VFHLVDENIVESVGALETKEEEKSSSQAHARSSHSRTVVARRASHPMTCIRRHHVSPKAAMAADLGFHEFFDITSRALANLTTDLSEL